MRLVVLLVLFLQLISTFNTYTQIHGINRQKQKIHINRTSELICIDGVLDEKTWSEAEKATGFQRVLPTDTGMAMSRTEVMLAYDNSNIYIGIICYDTIRGKRPVESLRAVDTAAGRLSLSERGGLSSERKRSLSISMVRERWPLQVTMPLGVSLI